MKHTEAKVSNHIIGLDIGGTKCSVVLAGLDGTIYRKNVFATTDCHSTLDRLFLEVEKLSPTGKSVFGVSCGSPLDSKHGIIQRPPNLPDWDDVAIVDLLKERFGSKAYLMNDANAGALAEWMFGQGRGYQNLIFLTYGTGMGAGIILNGQLYKGTCDNAGEVGHFRLDPDGPVGSGKAGSFEGFCSGAGIVKLGKLKAEQLNGRVSFCKEGDICGITTEGIAKAARAGDKVAIEIFQKSGHYAGLALSILIDLLNPEIIILGSVYLRCRDLLEPAMYKVIEQEVLPRSLKCCKIIPVSLGEHIGDLATVAIVRYKHFDTERPLLPFQGDSGAVV